MMPKWFEEYLRNLSKEQKEQLASYLETLDAVLTMDDIYEVITKK